MTHTEIDRDTELTNNVPDNDAYDYQHYINATTRHIDVDGVVRIVYNAPSTETCVGYNIDVDEFPQHIIDVGVRQRFKPPNVWQTHRHGTNVVTISFRLDPEFLAAAERVEVARVVHYYSECERPSECDCCPDVDAVPLTDIDDFEHPFDPHRHYEYGGCGTVRVREVYFKYAHKVPVPTVALYFTFDLNRPKSKD
jgi:hypothetical protein